MVQNPIAPSMSSKDQINSKLDEFYNLTKNSKRNDFHKSQIFFGLNDVKKWLRQVDLNDTEQETILELIENCRKALNDTVENLIWAPLLKLYQLLQNKIELKRDEFPASKESPKQCVNASNDDSNLDKTPEISKKPNEQPLRRVVAVKISETISPIEKSLQMKSSNETASNDSPTFRSPNLPPSKISVPKENNNNKIATNESNDNKNKIANKESNKKIANENKKNKNMSAEENDARTLAKIKTLDKFCHEIHLQITKYELSQLDNDDMEKDDSAYIKDTILKERFQKAYDKLLKLVSKNRHLVDLTDDQEKSIKKSKAPYLKRINIKSTRFPELNQMISTLLNDLREKDNLKSVAMPDYRDLHKVVTQANQEFNLGLNSDEKLMKIINDVSDDIRKIIKSKRQKWDWLTIESRVTLENEEINLNKDPSDENEELATRLRLNDHIASANTDKIIDEFVEKENSGEIQDDESENGSEEIDEEEENEERKEEEKEEDDEEEDDESEDEEESDEYEDEENGNEDESDANKINKDKSEDVYNYDDVDNVADNIFHESESVQPTTSVQKSVNAKKLTPQHEYVVKKSISHEESFETAQTSNSLTEADAESSTQAKPESDVNRTPLNKKKRTNEDDDEADMPNKKNKKLDQSEDCIILD